MLPYIYVTYARADEDRNRELCHTLARYGFRYRCVPEDTEEPLRARLMAACELVIALTSPAAEAALVVASDIRRALERGLRVLCVSLEANDADNRFCSGSAHGATLIPYPSGSTPDRHAVALFIHRLFVRHLSRFPRCFSEESCAEEDYGTAVRNAVHARLGDYRACYALGRAYEQGIGVPPLDNEAADWIRLSAEGGVIDARIRLGELRLMGKGTERDTDGALRLFIQAAEEGDVRGVYYRGLCYLYGYGVMKDPEHALRYLRLAADRGYAPALYRLGVLYRDGVGTRPLFRAAVRCFYKACAAGLSEGDTSDTLSEKAASDEIAEAVESTENTAADEIAEARKTDDASAAGEGAREGTADGEAADAPATSDTVPDEGKAAESLPKSPAETADESGETAPLCLFSPEITAVKKTGQKFACISMRQMRRVRLNGLLARRAAAEGRPHRPLSTNGFSRNRVMSVHLPEDAWLNTAFDHTTEEQRNRLRRMADSEPCYGEQTFGGTEGWTAYGMAEAALCLGRLMEQGSAVDKLCPVPTRALAWYRLALRLGHTEALFRLGNAYRRGCGVPADAARALRLYRTAADLGDERGQFATGVCLERGIGTAYNPAEAVRYYEMAAEAGYAPARNNLGGCYEHGIGVIQSYVTAVEWYTRAAAQGQPDAACRLGMCYESGHGVTADATRAFRLYEQAAARGHAYALYRLGLCYDCGVNTDTVPLGMAIPTDQESLPDGTDVSEASHSHSAAAKGKTDGLLRLPPDYVRAASLYEQAARGGVPEAAYALALCYQQGRGVQQDVHRCLGYLIEAADNHHIQACYELGMYYLEGDVTVRDRARAVDCFTRAAKLWRKRTDSLRMEREILPPDGLSTPKAAGGALYMLGYCALYGVGEASAPTEAKPSPQRVAAAASLFREAAEVDHAGAVTALGDLYRYGYLRPETASSEDEALQHYTLAARIAPARDRASRRMDSLTDSPVDALMSLAHLSLRAASEALSEGDRGQAELSWVQAWRCFSDCDELGSVDARIGMAECTFYGRGTPENRASALWHLECAERLDGGRVAASLWRGDFLRSTWNGEDETNLVAAEKAYLRALDTPCIESECGHYTVTDRRNSRREADRRARAEALYRLAVLRAVHFAADPDRKESFRYLAEAVLMKHPAARLDFARMYHYESAYIDKTNPAPKGKGDKSAPPAVNPLGTGARLRRRMAKEPPLSATRRDSRAGRSHDGWMTDYYTALWPEPIPFSYEMKATSDPKDRPAYVTEEVTDVMTASALNYLGDCLFYGKGLEPDAAAAVACYREVVSMRLQLARNQPVPPGVVWAQYSLGWCLLHGVGTARDLRGAVKWLTVASRTHGEACYCLAGCHERGDGVDVPDKREAIKYYRKAVKLGYRKADAKVAELEKQLRAEA